MFWGSRILELNETETESAKKGLNGSLHVASVKISKASD